MKKQYYFFYLDLALKDSNDNHVYASINVSHIPTKKLIEIFNIKTDKDPYILEGYFLTKSNYRKHKAYINEKIGPVNLDVFEYALGCYVSAKAKPNRKIYKKSLME